jgi:hypothetical protein
MVLQAFRIVYGERALFIRHPGTLWLDLWVGSAQGPKCEIMGKKQNRNEEDKI